MGSSLLKTYPSALQTIQQLDNHLLTLKVPPSWSIEDIIVNPDKAALVNEPEYSQPLCTAVQITLVRLMARWGVKPVSTIGHSSGKIFRRGMVTFVQLPAATDQLHAGEIAAAYAAGIISAERAITIAYYRGKVAASLRTDGAMLAVGVGAEGSNKISR